MSSSSTFVCPQGSGSSLGEGPVLGGPYFKGFPARSQTPSESIDARVRSLFNSLLRGSEELRLLRAGLVSAIDRATEAPWEQVNRRRLDLIDKDIEHGLSAAEKAELDVLEKKAEDYTNANAPVCFEIIDRLKECAARDGLTVNLD
jgi:hypothetical protein